MSNSDNNKSNSSEHDELLARAKKLQAETEANTTRKDFESNFFTNLINRFKQKNNWLVKVLSLLFLIIKQVWKFIAWVIYERKDGELVLNEDQSPVFSSKRAGTIGLAFICLGFAIHASVSAIYYYSTKFTETVYVTGKQEIITGELYQFGGCISLPCSTAQDNGKFYLIESSFYFPRLYYPEQNVFANIPQQNSACEIQGYGIYFRNFRWLYKSAQLYQHVTKVSCRPYTKEELEKAILDGKILDSI